jgi:hypothetical protein
MSANTATPNSPANAGSSPSPLFGLCECGDKFPDVSALMAHKMRHHMLEWPNVADAAKRLRTNLAVQVTGYISVRRDDVETLLSFADKKPNASDHPTAS